MTNQNYENYIVISYKSINKTFHKVLQNKLLHAHAFTGYSIN